MVLVRSYSFISGSTAQEVVTSRLRKVGAQDRFGLQLVRRIAVAIDEGDGDRLDVLADQRLAGA